MKEPNKDIDIFVKKLVQKSWKIVLSSELSRMWELSWWPKGKFQYAVIQSRNQWYITPMVRDVYFVGECPDKDVAYWPLIEKISSMHSPSGAIIAWEKSMELHLGNYSIPDILILYTRDVNKRIRLWDGRELHFRSLKSGEKQHGKNLYRLLEKNSQFINLISDASTQILSLEASILDAAALRIHGSWVSESLLEKFLKKYEKRLSRESLWELVWYRYIRAANRLRSFARDRGFSDFYEKMLDIIKKEWGGCFLNL